MKLTTRQIHSGEDEIIIRYKTMTPELETLIQMIQQGHPVVLGRHKERQYRIPPQDIYYFECVDEKTICLYQRQRISSDNDVSRGRRAVCILWVFPLQQIVCNEHQQGDRSKE